MKKVIVSTFLVLAISIASFAQETHFGLKAGINSSTLKIINAGDYDSKLGFYAGGLAHIHVKKHFAIQPELSFSTQGGKKGDNYTFRINYLNVPVLFQYMFDEGFRLQTGPQVGFMVLAEQEINNVTFNVKDTYSTIDFSWTFGGGYLFDSGLGIDVRYNLGINDISEDNSFETRNRVFQAGIFYQFMHHTTKKK
jgi:hypothetical protein